VADKARKPAGPAVPLAVTIATPMARQPSAFQNIFASLSLSMPLLLSFQPLCIERNQIAPHFAVLAITMLVEFGDGGGGVAIAGALSPSSE
jgi:hypothetical protein